MDKVEVKIGGFGGQGVILATIIIGRAATIYDKKFATLTQSFGPEARGSACSAQLIMSGEKILYPYVKSPNVLVIMSQEAYNRFSKEVRDDGILIIENELVKPKEVSKGIKLYGIPATRLAEEVGKRIVVNIVMIGFFTAITKLVSPDAVRSAIRDSVPAGTEELNFKAFEKGYNYGLTQK